jgi:hypothetical protein
MMHSRQLRPPHRIKVGWWSLAALLVACSGGTAEVKPVEAPAPVAPANPETPAVDVKGMAADSEKIALVPSPVETQKAMEASGIETQLATLIPKHDFDMAAAGTDHAAVRTGVVLADLLLTTKTAKKEELVVRLNGIDAGMKQLGGGDDISSTLKDYVSRIETDAVTRDELLKEFDELSGVIIPELEFNGQDRVVPLIEAGSWLEGANLVARALKVSTNKSAGEKLLKAPSVVDYFITYVRGEGAAKAPEAVTKKLDEALTTLKTLSEKVEPLDDADLDKIIKVTDEVMTLL